MNAFDDLFDLEARAQSKMNAGCWAYLSGGAGREQTLFENTAAFDRYWLRPHLARSDCSTPSLQTSLFGRVLPLPVLLAPTSPLRLFHPEAELAVARAAAKTGTIVIVSTDSHYPLEDIAAAADGAWWFQLYAYRDTDLMLEMIDLAIDLGAEAIVVTMDAHFAGLRRRAARSGFSMPLDADYHLLRRFGVLQGDNPSSGRLERLALTADNLRAIRNRSSVPVVVKGVTRASDALLCEELGIECVIVSNHGGRQLDGTVSSIAVLEEVVGSVQKAAVLLDSGIRRGSDVVKALALGARAVCIGRPYIWGLAIDGQQGVQTVLSILQYEILDVLRQMSIPTLQHITADDVQKSSGVAPGSGMRLPQWWERSDG